MKFSSGFDRGGLEEDGIHRVMMATRQRQRVLGITILYYKYEDRLKRCSVMIREDKQSCHCWPGLVWSK